MRRTYGTEHHRLLASFNPSLQTKYSAYPARCFFGTAPQLSVVGEAYGQSAAVSWLEIQLNDLSEFAGSRHKLTKERCKETAEIIARRYGHFKLTELMLFFHRLKSGDYGSFYGTIDPMMILKGLAAFSEQRNAAKETEALRKIREQRERQERDNRDIRRRYKERVPDAYSPEAPLSFVQYQLLGYDSMSDDRLRAEIEKIRRGKKKEPRDIIGILEAREMIKGR